MKQLIQNLILLISVCSFSIVGVVNAQVAPENIDYISGPGGSFMSNASATFAIALNPDMLFPVTPAAAEFNLLMYIPSSMVTGNEIFTILDDNMNGGNMVFQPCSCPGDGFIHMGNTYFSFVYSGSGINLGAFGTGSYQLAFSVLVSNGNASAVWEIADASTQLYIDFSSRSALNVLGYNELKPLQGGAQPVSLTSFSAQPLNTTDALLNWETASELNSSHYEIERSTDGRNWEFVGKVTSSGKSDQTLNYSYLDEGVYKPGQAERRFYYRLRMVDLDGSFEYSDVDEVEFRNSTDLTVELYPNPAQEFVNINFLSDSPKGSVNLQLMNVAGKALLERQIMIEDGHYLLELPQVLPTGVYMVRLTTTEHESVSKRFVVQQLD